MNRLDSIINENPVFDVVYLTFNNNEQAIQLIKAIEKFNFFNNIKSMSELGIDGFTSFCLDFREKRIMISEKEGASLTLERISRDFEADKSRVMVCNSDVFFKLEKHKKIKFKIDV